MAADDRGPAAGSLQAPASPVGQVADEGLRAAGASAVPVRPDVAALPGPLALLAEQERVLRYPNGFGAREALTLGCACVRLAADYDRGVTIEIRRATDDLVLFAWSDDRKAPRNYGFTQGKIRAARACGHSSLWAYAAHELTGAYAELADAASGACLAAGAVPVRAGANGSWVATLAVSGLHEGQDHELAVRALAAALDVAYGQAVPVYQGPLR